jgi:hypothetical protein
MRTNLKPVFQILIYSMWIQLKNLPVKRNNLFFFFFKRYRYFFTKNKVGFKIFSSLNSADFFHAYGTGTG